MSNRLVIDEQVKHAIGVLKNGGIVAYPTDTVYGLGADPYNENAVDRIYCIKKRSRTLALPLLLSDKADLLKVADFVPEMAWKLADSFFPGQLTMVLKKSTSIPDFVTAGGNTIAVRVPDHAVPVALIQGLGCPLVGTSANISGMPSPKTAEKVYQQLGGHADFIIDGGVCTAGVVSTVIDLTGSVPVILREGAVSMEAIAKVCGPDLIVEWRSGRASES